MSFSNPEKIVPILGLAPGMKVADFGAGAGAYAFAAARFVVPGGKVYAVDVQKSLLEKVEREAKARGLDHIKTVWGDIEKRHGSHFHDGEMDCVIVSNILFQAGDKEALLQEAVRVLRTHGRILVVDWSDSFSGLGPDKDHVVPRERVVEILRRLNIGQIADAPAGDHHWGIVGEKSVR